MGSAAPCSWPTRILRSTALSSPITPPGYHLNFTRLSVAASTSLPASRMVFIQNDPSGESVATLKVAAWLEWPANNISAANNAKTVCLISN